MFFLLRGRFFLDMICFLICLYSCDNDLKQGSSACLPFQERAAEMERARKRKKFEPGALGERVEANFP